ncbi:MAG TPA: AAA family ATPase [Ferrovibrio sp.]|uniref:bifunctional aminoglycoside phosphotransferase/ATP-binding protein n=1 Tax=Ferrovibrio sp. TaxID=1917215 RepID=UPI002ED6C1AA
MLEPNPADIAALFDPPPDAVLETHISRIYLCGDRAWKLKKAVTLPYVDFASLQQRRAACEREVALNRRTAPELYIGVRAVYRGADGRLGFAEHGLPLEWLVEMQRFDPSQTLDRLAAQDGLTPEMVDILVETIADFHAKADRSPQDGLSALAKPFAMNDAAFAGLEKDALPATELAALRASLAAEQRKQRQLLIRRGAAGRIRRLHGDLHLRNIVLIDGRPVLFDCLEFDEALGTGDTFYDFAFLLMDLLAGNARHGGRRDLANRALNHYLELSDDYEGAVLLPLYVALRAAIRCHVAALNRDTWSEARRYLALARRVLQPVNPQLIVIGGLSGTGKSTIARRVAPALGMPCGAVILRSDVIRKRQFGIPVLQRLPKEAYTAESGRRTYQAMLERAGDLLRGGATVILDAVFGLEEERHAAEALAQDCGAGFSGLWLEAPLHILTSRVSARARDASDATADVVHWQSQTLTPPQDWIGIDVSGPPDPIVAAVVALLTHR